MGMAPIWSLGGLPPGHWVGPWVGSTISGQQLGGLELGYFKICSGTKVCRPAFRVMDRCDSWVPYQMVL